MKISCLTAILVFYGAISAAQSTSEEYLNNKKEEDYTHIYSDYSIFMLPMDMVSYYQRVAPYAFKHISNQERGLDRRFSAPTLGYMPLGNPITATVDYNTLSSYNALNGRNREGYVSLYGSNKNYRLGIKTLWFDTVSDFELGVLAGRRWGRDANIKGVFSDDWSFATDIKHKSGLSIFFAINPSQRGLRSFSTQEAFDLMDDNLYNPAWGYQGDKIRNSKVERRAEPYLLSKYEKKLWDKTTLNAAISYGLSSRRRSSLAWFDASSPIPDYYYNLPSYFNDESLREFATSLWRDQREDIVHINWQQLYSQNAAQATYILEDRVERGSSGSFYALLTSTIDKYLSIEYGFKGTICSTELYKQVRDMLSSAPFYDIDQYLVGDEKYGDALLNNSNDPNRLISKGDKFGYNSTIKQRNTTLVVNPSYLGSFYTIKANMELESNTLQRRGNYKKELFDGNLSFGNSKKMKFDNYIIGVEADFRLSTTQSISGKLLSSSHAPLYSEVFLNPQYNNLTISNPKSLSLSSFETTYYFRSPKVSFDITGYVISSSKGSAIYRYFDDIAKEYCDMELRDIGKTSLGVELGVKIPLSPRITLYGVGTLASLRYSSNPVSTIWRDSDHTRVEQNSVVALKGYHLGNTPQTALSIQGEYSTFSGWWIKYAVNYLANSYVEPSPLRRTSRALSGAGSKEGAALMSRQEPLPQSITTDLFIHRRFKALDRDVVVQCGINNIFSSQAISRGYEPMRLRQNGNSYHPFNNRYLYAYPRSYLFSIKIDL